MNIFDFIFIIFLIFFFIRGFLKGFFHALIGPACLVFWSIIGILHYDLDNNTITAVFVTVLGSIITTAIIMLVLFLGKRQVLQQHRHYVFWGSRISGAVTNTAWNGILIAILAIMLSLMPKNFMNLEKAQQEIRKSKSYRLFYSYLINPVPAIRNVQMTVAVFQDYRRLEQYKESSEYTAVFSDPKIQSVINNPDIMEKIYSRDAASLLTNHQIKQILKDEYLMLKISDLGQKIYQNESQRQFQ